MKISIVTAVFNAETTLQDTIDSVAMQTYVDREHILVDGASRDGTMAVVEANRAHFSHVVSERDRGVYDAMNKGLALASGDIVAFLNADDVYLHESVLTRVAEIMADPAVDACYADLYFVAQHDTTQVVRFMESQTYRAGLFERGWMPPHPTLFVRRSVLARTGGFDLQFPQQADFDLALRLFHGEGFSARYVHETCVRMRMGGLSNRSWRHVVRGNMEAYRACKKNGLKVWPWFPLVKVASRIPEFLAAKKAPV